MIGLFSPIFGWRRRQPPCHIRMSRLRRRTRALPAGTHIGKSSDASIAWCSCHASGTAYRTAGTQISCALKIQLQNQSLGLPFKSTFHNLPPRLELQGRRKQRFRCHRSHPVPPRQGFTRAGNEALVPCLPRAPRAPYQNKIIPIYQLSTAGSHVYSPGLT